MSASSNNCGWAINGFTISGSPPQSRTLLRQRAASSTRSTLVQACPMEQTWSRCGSKRQGGWEIRRQKPELLAALWERRMFAGDGWGCREAGSLVAVYGPL